MTRIEILDILKKYKNENAEKFGIKMLGLFGSFSRGDAIDASDIDIIIDITIPDLFMLVHIKEELEELLHKSVDIIRNRENINPYLKRRIIKDAVYV